MKSWLLKNWILSLALIAGLICSLILCGIRAGIEAGDCGVSIIMSNEDVASLAAAEGISFDEYAEKLLDAGLTATFTPGEICDELGLFIGDSYNGENATLGLIEDGQQYSYLPIHGFKYSEESNVVRVFKLIPEYAARYAVLGYSGPQEIENLTYRTITDRNIRVIWLCPFSDSSSGAVISNPEDYISVIRGVATRIVPHGLHLGQFTVLDGYTPNLWLILGTIAGTAAAAVLLLGSVIILRRRLSILLFFVCFLGECAVWHIYPWMIPLAASIIYPCLSVWLVAQTLIKIRPKTNRHLLLIYFSILISGFSVALIGCNAIGALQSSRAYLLAVDNFRGVKLSQTLPLIYAAFICIKTLYRGKTAREFFDDYRTSRRLAVIMLAIMLLAAVLYILRTGDGLLSAGIYEQRFRNYLEQLLIARPRTKEFLVAWPSIAFAVVLMSKGSRRYALPFAIFSSVGFASAVNTFCHSRSPLWLSLSRSALGLFVGAALGFVIILIFTSKKTPLRK